MASHCSPFFPNPYATSGVLCGKLLQIYLFTRDCVFVIVNLNSRGKHWNVYRRRTVNSHLMGRIETQYFRFLITRETQRVRPGRVSNLWDFSNSSDFAHFSLQPLPYSPETLPPPQSMIITPDQHLRLHSYVPQIPINYGKIQSKVQRCNNLGCTQ